MFEQPETARKPYSMVLSLILQILVLGALCLAPLFFPQMLVPELGLKSLVLAAPPKPPAAIKAVASSSHAPAAPARSFVLVRGPLVIKPMIADAPAVEAAPEIEGAGTPGGVPYGMSDTLPQVLPVAPPAAKAKPETPKAIRVGGSVSSANLIRMVQPVYPPLARSTRVQGTVEFTATISKEGIIENLVLVHGHPLLIHAAKDAVLQWRYRPTLLNGEPVEVITDIVVNFALSQ